MASKKLVWNPEVDRLTQPELSYELTSRGFDAGTVKEMRKSFRSLLRMEADQTLSSVSNPMTFATDKEAILRSFTELETLFGTFDGDKNSFRRVSALMCHLIRRIDRANAKDPEDLITQREWVLKAQNLKSDFEAKHKKLSRNSTVTNSITAPTHTSSPLRRTNSNASDSSTSSDDEPLPTSTSWTNYRVPVVKWGLTYNGEPSVSLNSFLERVEELCRTRNVSVSELFASAAELFSGDALLWYRSEYRDFCNWDDVVTGLRAQFLPTDYDEKLLMEIWNRVQSPNERPTLFAAAMRGLYRRLSKMPLEAAQVRRIIKNLQPRFSQALALTNIDTYHELIKQLRQIEDIFSDPERFESRPRTSRLLEPDFAAKPISLTKRVDTVDTPKTVKAKPTAPKSKPSGSGITSSSLAICWNCRKTGHISLSCPQPQRTHCYRCGYLNHTTRTCPKCNRTSENLGVSHRTE